MIILQNKTVILTMLIILLLSAYSIYLLLFKSKPLKPFSRKICVLELIIFTLTISLMINYYFILENNVNTLTLFLSLPIFIFSSILLILISFIISFVIEIIKITIVKK